MTESMDALTTKLEGFDAMMQKILDKVTGLEAWKTAADASMDALISKANATATHLRRLEVPPPPLQAASTAYSPPPPPAWVNPFDLNLAPRQAARPSASALERPSGHPHDSSHRDAGGGILGSHPRHPVTGGGAGISQALFHLEVRINGLFQVCQQGFLWPRES
ncbi:hypothetical protein PAHAL_3G085500 [Panicum hallii]|uniref:Uncharacterized protein n=1 Tax=Panicum hallii TaxID=206008 RepID=A0A2T8KHI8_9POAL|nr:hypothetical protein PAHAL_3G085500 [Panicum hallii]